MKMWPARDPRRGRAGDQPGSSVTDPLHRSAFSRAGDVRDDRLTLRSSNPAVLQVRADGFASARAADGPRWWRLSAGVTHEMPMVVIGTAIAASTSRH